MKLLPRNSGLVRRNGALVHRPKNPPISKQALGPKKAGVLADPSSDTTPDALSIEQLIARAKRSIGAGETSRNESFRAAADDIARACEKGLTQREAAKEVGKSGPWVNQLLKWRKDGYVGAPFADKKIVVQALNKSDLRSEDVATKSTTASARPDSANSEAEGCNLLRSVAPLQAAISKTSTDASIDCRLPQALNRQNPERAYQRLAEQWSTTPFRNLFLDSPRAAQLRFLRDVVLNELGGPVALNLSASDEVTVQ